MLVSVGPSIGKEDGSVSAKVDKGVENTAVESALFQTKFNTLRCILCELLGG